MRDADVSDAGAGEQIASLAVERPDPGLLGQSPLLSSVWVNAPERQWTIQDRRLRGKVISCWATIPNSKRGHRPMRGDFGGKAMTYTPLDPQFEEARSGAAGVLVFHEPAPGNL